MRNESFTTSSVLKQLAMGAGGIFGCFSRREQIEGPRDPASCWKGDFVAVGRDLAIGCEAFGAEVLGRSRELMEPARQAPPPPAQLELFTQRGAK